MTIRDIFLTVQDMQLIRGTSLSGLTDLLGQLGGDPHALLRAVGIPASSVGRQDRFVPLLPFVRAFEAAAAITGRPDFGRLVAQTQGIEILGPVGVAARTAANVADALTILERYLTAFSPGLAVRLQSTEVKELVFFEFAFLDDDLGAVAQSTEFSLGVSLRVLRSLMGHRFTPAAVHLPHDPLTPSSDYRRYYGCRPLFAQPASGFTLSAADLQRPMSYDRLAHEAVLAYLATFTDPDDSADGSALRSVRVLAGQLLPTGTTTLPVIARQLGTHPKALQRRLSAEGTTFGEIIDGMRRERTDNLLRNTNVPLSQLARDLGYAEHSVLTRSCRRWFGCPPAEYRRRHKP